MYTPIKLDKDRNVLLGFEALQHFKKLTGKSMLKLELNADEIEDYIPLIYFVGLVHEDKELTLEATTKLLDKYMGLKKALDKFYEIFDGQLGADEDNSATEKN